MSSIPASRNFVSIVVPCHNESSSIDLFYRTVTAVFATLPHMRFEIVCIDDGSHDDTLSKLIDIVARDPRVRAIELSRNFGKEAAMTAGIDAARGDAVIPMDADLQDPPELIGKLIAEWQKGAEVVLARRVDRSSDSLLKRSTAAMFYRLHNKLSSIAVPEDVGDFRLIDRIAIDALAKLPERQRFMKGLFAWVGFRTVVVDYARAPRVAGTSKFSGWKLWNFALEGITSFSTAPLQIWTYIGAIGAFFTFIYASFIVIRTALYGADVPGYASLLVAVLFLGSLQLISVGVLGEYIGRIYMESKGRPTYLVRQMHEQPAKPVSASAA